MYPKPKSRNTKVKKKNKVHLIFDETKRREFLTGFHKRKLERKKKAKEKFEKQLKEEKKRLKAEARESYKKLVKSYAPIPEVEDLFAKEYDDSEVNVKITEISANELTKTNDWIGANQPTYESDQEEADSDAVDDDQELLPGMELDLKPSKRESRDEAVEILSKKDIKKILKKKATKNVQKSKTFQKKGRMEQQKQKHETALRKRQNLKHKKKKRVNK
uniref:Nucleolar protein 12 n=1 Tax=Photinus pyralis TaxID=7054 RepID=A0A1Y1LYC9_PHOPY